MGGWLGYLGAGRQSPYGDGDECRRSRRYEDPVERVEQAHVGHGVGQRGRLKGTLLSTRVYVREQFFTYQHEQANDVAGLRTSAVGARHGQEREYERETEKTKKSLDLVSKAWRGWV